MIVLKHLLRWANIQDVAIALKCFYMYSKKSILLFPQDLDDAEEDDLDAVERHDEF